MSTLFQREKIEKSTARNIQYTGPLNYHFSEFTLNEMSYWINQSELDLSEHEPTGYGRGDMIEVKSKKIKPGESYYVHQSKLDFSKHEPTGYGRGDMIEVRDKKN